ncbi:MAG: GIY-YIG nuclease family protein [Firmicutes bacterium]|jgi:putative endonuclease|nr:GIY-YIG nuclease family protein [Bacillota bacterium]
MHLVYIVECCDGTLYTGYTTDLEQRLKAHNQGRGAKYTRARRPVRLVYWEGCESKSAALRRERHIKSRSREAKLQLIREKG